MEHLNSSLNAGIGFGRAKNSDTTLPVLVFLQYYLESRDDNNEALHISNCLRI